MKIRYLLPLAGLLVAGCVTETHTVNVPPPGPTLAEIQSMVQNHVGDTVIISQVQNSSTRYQLTAEQIIALKQAGASDALLNALISSANKPAAQSSSTTTTVYPPPYVYPWPWWGWGWDPYYYGGYYHGYYRYPHHH